MSSSSSLSTPSPPQDMGDSRARQNSTAERIAKYTIISSVTGAAFTAFYESTIGRAQSIRRLETQSSAGTSNVGHGKARRVDLRTDAAKFYRHNTALLSASAGLNSGLVAFAFFGLREHLVSPALAELRPSNSNTRTGGSSSPLTWSTMRMHHLEDSALTGALLGGVFNAWKKGPRGLFPGAATASLACTALQAVVNELGVQRVRYVSRLGQPPSPPASVHTTSPSSRNPWSEEPTTNSGTPAWTNSPQSTQEEEAPRLTLGERILTFIGISKVDDEEYLRRLKAKREIYLARIRKLEAQLEEEKLRSSDSKDGSAEGKSSGED